MLSIFWLLEHPLAVISNRVGNFFSFSCASDKLLNW